MKEKTETEKKGNGWIVAAVALMALIVMIGALMSKFPTAHSPTAQIPAADTNVAAPAQAQPVHVPTDLPPGSVVAKAAPATMDSNMIAIRIQKLHLKQ